MRDLMEAVRRLAAGEGEADEGSDVDLLLLLEGQVQVGREIRRSSDLAASLALESSRVLSLIPVVGLV